MAAARRPGHQPVTREIDEQTGIGELYMAALIRTQLRLAISVCVVFTVVLGGLPLLFAVLPGLGTWSLLGVPLPWLVLGALVYPVIILGGWRYTVLAERNEREFADLVERS